MHLNQPPGGVEQTAGEHDVPDDLPVVPGNQRQAILRRDGLPQGMNQVGHDKAVVTERPQVDLPHRLFIVRKFFAKLHGWMVRTPPGCSHTLLSPDGQRCSAGGS